MAALDLAASGMVAHIDSWFDAGWLDPMMTGSKAALHDDLVNARTPDLSSARAASLRYVRDVEAEIGTWAAFRDEEPASPAFVPVLPVRTTPKVGRNDPCPCGSGKKYKKCCGAG
jgi:preprotein translocase subunit SecA